MNSDEMNSKQPGVNLRQVYDQLFYEEISTLAFVPSLTEISLVLYYFHKFNIAGY